MRLFTDHCASLAATRAGWKPALRRIHQVLHANPYYLRLLVPSAARASVERHARVRPRVETEGPASCRSVEMVCYNARVQAADAGTNRGDAMDAGLAPFGESQAPGASRVAGASGDERNAKGAPTPDVRSLADRYQVLARVGVGGTAMVYRCVDLHTQRILAVKVLRTTGRMIPEAEARFKREARLAASLTHPSIVRVLDFGYTLPPETPTHVPWQDETDGPVPYLAMEYVFGSTLKELVRRRGPLPIDWVWCIGEQLCVALGAAHALGVVHRDLKPQNVMILDSRLELLAKLA